MRRISPVVIAAPAAVLALALFLPGGVASPPEVQHVFVTNFPTIFAVEGTVAVKGSIRQAVLVPYQAVAIPPVALEDNSRRIDGGTLNADGFSHMVRSLSGQIKRRIRGHSAFCSKDSRSAA
jgi:hypothetical protein